jgi:hypothetical protein
MARAKAPSPYAGRAVVSFTGGGTSISVSAPLADTSARSKIAAVRSLLRELGSRATAELLAPVQPAGTAAVEQVQAKAVPPGKNMGLDGKVRPNRPTDNTRRNAYIVHRRNEGASLRMIAAEAQCSVGTVHRVVTRATVG